MKNIKRFTSFDRNNLNQVRILIDEKLKDLKEYGLVLELGSISFAEKTFTGKLLVSIVTAETEGMNPIEIKCRENLLHYAKVYDVNEKMIGKKVIDGKGNRMIFIGLMPNKKFAYTFKCADGRTMNGSREYAASLLGLKKEKFNGKFVDQFSV